MYGAVDETLKSVAMRSDFSLPSAGKRPTSKLFGNIIPPSEKFVDVDTDAAHTQQFCTLLLS